MTEDTLMKVREYSTYLLELKELGYMDSDVVPHLKEALGTELNKLVGSPPCRETIHTLETAGLSYTISCVDGTIARVLIPTYPQPSKERYTGVYEKGETLYNHSEARTNSHGHGP